MIKKRQGIKKGEGVKINKIAKKTFRREEILSFYKKENLNISQTFV